MFGDRPDRPRLCGRSIYGAPSSVDNIPVCLMHSADPQKSDTQFQEEFERILHLAGEGLADFSGFIFPSSNYGRQFSARCCFAWAIFTRDANFNGAKFTRVDFGLARFDQDANFNSATFAEQANFSYATFKQNANFTGGWNEVTQDQNKMFAQNATFASAHFERDAHFNASRFDKIANFTGARFMGAAEFRRTAFRHDARGKDHEPGPVFSETAFDSPEKVAFYQTDLGQALFHNCDVSKLNFSDVNWRTRKNRKSMVLDEVVDPRFLLILDAVVDPEYSEERPSKDIPLAESLQPRNPSADPRNYRLIEELYQKLKRNYDDHADYRVAGDFHYGEMELKRQRSDRRNGVPRWLHRNLGLVAWYKYASEYGERYARPGLWLALVFFAFMLLYPVVGMDWDANRSCSPVSVSATAKRLTYWQPLQDSSNSRSVWRARQDLVGHSLVTTLYVAAFQKDLIYQPSYPWGRLLVLAETLLTSTMAALLLLAVRRQFKR